MYRLRWTGGRLSVERISGGYGYHRWFPPPRTDAAEGACNTYVACRLSSWEVLYAEIHLQDARGRGRDPDALRRGAHRTGSRPREPDRGDAPRRHPRPRAGARGCPPAVLLPGGNFLNPIVLEWFLPLAERHRLYAPDVVGQPGKSAQERPSPKGDGHAFWVEDVLDGLGLARAARGDLLRGGHSHQDHGSGPRARLQGGARRPLRHSRGPRFADARRSRRHLASLPPEAHIRAPVARGAAHTDGARGPRLRPRRPADRGRLPAPQARRRAPPEGQQGRARKFPGAGGGVRLRGGCVLPRPDRPPEGEGDLPQPRHGRVPRRLPPRSLEGGARSGERARPRLPRWSRGNLATVGGVRRGPLTTTPRRRGTRRPADPAAARVSWGRSLPA